VNERPPGEGLDPTLAVSVDPAAQGFGRDGAPLALGIGPHHVGDLGQAPVEAFRLRRTLVQELADDPVTPQRQVLGLAQLGRWWRAEQSSGSRRRG
jgi:hypothetical protein